MEFDKKKIIIIIATTLAVIVLLNILSQGNTTKNLQSYITKKGYTNEKGSYIYTKQISDIDLDTYYDLKDKKQDAKYEINYFDTKAYKFTKNKRIYEDNLDSTLNMIYEFKTDTINYNYRAVINNASFIFKGTYQYNTKKETFTCEKDYAYNFKIDNNDTVTCDKLKSDNSNFYNEILNTITNARLLVNLKKK